jgi:hypothetical protein
MQRSYKDNPKYKEVKELYFSSSLTLSECCRRKDVIPSTGRYWSEVEAWAARRKAMQQEYPEFQNAQAEKRRKGQNAAGDGEAERALALLDEIQEIRTSTPAKLRGLMQNEGAERHRRYLILMRVADALAGRLASNPKATDAERLARALATVLDKAQMLAGLPTSITEQKRSGPQRATRPARADVDEVRGALTGGGAPVEAEPVEEEDREGEEPPEDDDAG